MDYRHRSGVRMLVERFPHRLDRNRLPRRRRDPHRLDAVRIGHHVQPVAEEAVAGCDQLVAGREHAGDRHLDGRLAGTEHEVNLVARPEDRLHVGDGAVIKLGPGVAVVSHDRPPQHLQDLIAGHQRLRGPGHDRRVGQGGWGGRVGQEPLVQRAVHLELQALFQRRGNYTH